MSRYALLIAPSTNRVYAEAALGLTRAELSIFSTVTAPIRDIAENRLGGVPYVTFEAELGSGDLRYLANLSSMYALFELGDGVLIDVSQGSIDHAFRGHDVLNSPGSAGRMRAKSSPVSRPESLRISARSSTLRNSRTLPGQS